MTFELVVLGSSGTHPGPGRLCSGFLVRTATTRVVLDIGNGTLANLLRHTHVGEVDVIVITHRHPDHCADLIGAYYAMRFHPDGEQHVDVLAPAGTLDFVAQWLPESRDDLTERCRFTDVAAGDRHEVGDVVLTFHESPHVVPTVAVRVESGGRVLAYTSDTGGGGGIEEAASGADLLLCEATWSGDPEDWPSGLHLTGSGAGRLARAAGVARLALTHVAPYVSREQVREEAAAAFGSEVTLVEDGDVLDIGGAR